MSEDEDHVLLDNFVCDRFRISSSCQSSTHFRTSRAGGADGDDADAFLVYLDIECGIGEQTDDSAERLGERTSILLADLAAFWRITVLRKLLLSNLDSRLRDEDHRSGRQRDAPPPAANAQPSPSAANDSPTTSRTGGPVLLVVGESSTLEVDAQKYIQFLWHAATEQGQGVSYGGPTERGGEDQRGGLSQADREPSLSAWLKPQRRVWNALVAEVNQRLQNSGQRLSFAII